MATPPKPRIENIEDLPEAGCPVFLRAIRLSERRKLMELESTQQAIKTLAQCVVDGEGNPIWTEEDWDVFAGNEAKRFRDLVHRSFKQSGLVEEEAKKEEAPS